MRSAAAKRLPSDLRISEAHAETENFLFLRVNLPGLQIDAQWHTDPGDIHLAWKPHSEKTSISIAKAAGSSKSKSSELMLAMPETAWRTTMGIILPSMNSITRAKVSGCFTSYPSKRWTRSWRACRTIWLASGNPRPVARKSYRKSEARKSSKLIARLADGNAEDRTYFIGLLFCRQNLHKNGVASAVYFVQRRAKESFRGRQSLKFIMDPEERLNDDYSLPARRQNDLLRLAHSRGQVMVNDLAEHFEVSVDTIRRDLDALASRGLLTRTHGGAVPVEQLVNRDSPFAIKMQTQTAEKRRIARAAADLIRDGETLIINGGSTTHYFAEELGHRSKPYRGDK